MKEDYPAANYIILGTYDRTVLSLQKKTKTDVYLQGVYDELNELKSNVKYEDGEFVDMPEV